MAARLCTLLLCSNIPADFLLQGYIATTIQQYLSEHPVDENDVVHVEDGGWVNPDGDFGSPQSLKWNYPLMPNNAQVNLTFIERVHTHRGYSYIVLNTGRPV